MKSISGNLTSELEAVIERQTKVWIAVQTLLMVIIFLVAAMFLYQSLLRVFSSTAY